MRTTVLSLLIAAGLAFASDSEAFERQDWVADFEQLKTALTEHYPNLEWAAERGMDLAAIERRARERLAASTTDFEARVALERFVASFGDGHVSLSWPGAHSSERNDPPAVVNCKNLGYEESPDTRAIARNLTGYQSLPTGGGMEAGMLTISGKQVAVLRIPIFKPSLAMCETASLEILVSKKPCDEACKTAIEQRSDNFFLREIDERLRQLADRHPDMLLVDVAGNGGGNDTAIALARMLTDRQLRTPAIAFVRDAARARQLTEDATALESALHGATRSETAFLKPLIAGLTNASRQASQRCELTALWSGKPVACSNLIRGSFFAGGMITEELPEAFRDKPWAGKVSWTAHLRYSASLWKGPIILLVDGGSASATELFVAMLRDAGRARVIGAPTLGAGCGWTSPRNPTELAHSGGELHMPDCARFRTDDTNELDGIQPDDLVGFRRYDSPRQQVARLTPKLEDVVLEVARQAANSQNVSAQEPDR